VDERKVGAATTTHNSVSGNAVINGPVVMAGRVESLSMTLAPLNMTPRQVPPAIASFVNRTAELDRLRSIADGLRGSHAPGVVVLSGLGGVGKTQLVAQWVAKALASSYPGGHLYVDLEEGRRDGAGDVSGALAGFLRALGVHREYMPADLGERAALFRSVTAGRDTLVVVDNARQAAEVRSLVPSTGLLVATSRIGLPALAMDGAVAIDLQPLDERAGVELVRSWRVADADSAAEALVQLCSGLPLALRTVGEWLAKHPQLSLTDAVNALGAGGLEPSEDGATAVKTVLDMAYEGLSDHTRQLYRLLGCLPGTTITGGLATAAGLSAVEDAVGELLTAHLVVVVQSSDRPRRFRPHDVVREHTWQAARRLPETERLAALRAVADFYTAAVAHADVLVLGAGRFRLQTPPTRSLDELSPSEPLFTDGAEALEWLDAERGNLLALLRAAADERWDDTVWQLCESMWALFDARKHYLDSIEAHGLGIAAARRCGRADAEVRMRNQLARAHYGLGAYSEAGRTLAQAETLLDRVTDARLSGMIRETQGLIALASGAHDDAYTLFNQALEANTATQDTHGVVVQSYNIGQVLVAAGRPAEALDMLGKARATAADNGDHGMLPRIDIVLARALQRLNRLEAASEAAIRAAEEANERKQYAKLDQALGVLSELAASVSNTRLRAACDAKLRELHRGVGVTPEGG
jgi:tetratricopeptide (TPR) repeat protein